MIGVFNSGGSRGDGERKTTKPDILESKLDFEGDIFDKSINVVLPHTGEDSIISFHKCTFKSFIALQEVKAKEISFIDCTFEKEFFLIKSEIAIIGFTDCVFMVNIVLTGNNCSNFTNLRKVKTPELKVEGNYHKFQIVSSNIENVNIKDINSNSAKKDSKIEFLIENEIRRVEIKPYSTYSHISFKGSSYDTIFLEGTFNNQIVFDKNVVCKDLFFESSTCNYRIDILEGNFQHIYFYRSLFTGLVHVNDFDGDNIKDFSRDLEIETLWFHSCTFDKDVAISLSKIKHLTVSNNNFKQLFSFNNYYNGEIDEKGINDVVMVRINGTNRGTVVIERVYLDIELGGINFGDVFIKDSKLYSFFLMDFDNKGSISLKDVNGCEFFTIHNSNSGHLKLVNADISKFNEVVIADSNIEGLETTKYPKNIRSYSSNPKVGYGLSNKSRNNSNLKNIYNQLKQIAKNKGDTQALYKYQSMEHEKLLLSKRLGFDSILLSLNWLSNRNGKSWSRGVLFTLIISFLFYLAYSYSIESDFDKESLKDYVLFISSFPKLSLDKFKEFDSVWYVSLIIWLSRIFISYGIYQTVSAFRKYGKS